MLSAPPSMQEYRLGTVQHRIGEGLQCPGPVWLRHSGTLQLFLRDQQRGCCLATDCEWHTPQLSSQSLCTVSVCWSLHQTLVVGGSCFLPHQALPASSWMVSKGMAGKELALWWCPLCSSLTLVLSPSTSVTVEPPAEWFSCSCHGWLIFRFLCILSCFQS